MKINNVKINGNLINVAVFAGVAIGAIAFLGWLGSYFSNYMAN